MGDYLKDAILAVVFFMYPFLLLVMSKGLAGMGMRKDSSRKFVHTGMGLVILFIPYFTHLWIALIPPILFTAINLIDYKFGWFSQIQGEDQGNVGTVLYPISYIILMSIFFHTKWWGLAVIGILTMALGDAGASIIGRALGKTKYAVNGEVRSYAGSVTMFVVTFMVALAVLLFKGPEMAISMTFLSLFATSFLIASVATIVEALSTKGSDNLTVPVLTALASWALITVFMSNVLGNEGIVKQPLF